MQAISQKEFFLNDQLRTALTKRGVTLMLAMGVASTIYWGLDLDEQLRIGLAVLAGIAILWITETFHVSVTALLVPILAVVSGTLNVTDALKNFAHPIIFLFLGGFALAAALRKQRLDVRLAAQVIGIARGRLSLACILLFVVTSSLSMWVSNTATTAMMLPLGMGLLANHPYGEHQRTHWFLLLGIAYSANVGGIGTLVGSPPNAIAAAVTGLEFTDWLLFGLPTAFVMLPVVIAVLWWAVRPDFPDQRVVTEQLIPMHGIQWLTLAVFLLTVSLWLFSKPLAQNLGIEKGFDSVVAIMALILVTALRLVDWKDIDNTVDWGVLLLFGGGLTLSSLLKETGTSIFLGESLTGLMYSAPLFLFLLVVTGFVVMLTEVASNTASTALLVPIFVPIAEAMDLPSATMAAVIAIAASCAFMLPVATPPNAIVFGTGNVPQSQMVRVGLLLNICMILLIAAGAWLFL